MERALEYLQHIEFHACNFLLVRFREIGNKNLFYHFLDCNFPKRGRFELDDHSLLLGEYHNCPELHSHSGEDSDEESNDFPVESRECTFFGYRTISFTPEWTERLLQIDCETLVFKIPNSGLSWEQLLAVVREKILVYRKIEAAWQIIRPYNQKLKEWDILLDNWTEEIPREAIWILFLRSKFDIISQLIQRGYSIKQNELPFFSSDSNSFRNFNQNVLWEPRRPPPQRIKKLSGWEEVLQNDSAVRDISSFLRRWRRKASFQEVPLEFWESEVFRTNFRRFFGILCQTPEEQREWIFREEIDFEERFGATFLHVENLDLLKEILETWTLEQRNRLLVEKILYTRASRDSLFHSQKQLLTCLRTGASLDATDSHGNTGHAILKAFDFSERDLRFFSDI